MSNVDAARMIYCGIKSLFTPQTYNECMAEQTDGADEIDEADEIYEEDNTSEDAQDANPQFTPNCQSTIEEIDAYNNRDMIEMQRFLVEELHI